MENSNILVNNWPKISIIVPYYNSEKTILRALNSIIRQTYKNIEIILIDDGCSDYSSQLVNDFIKNNKEYKITNIRQDNYGAAKARNVGIKKAQGEYIAFLDSDDSWETGKLEKQLNVFDSYKYIDIVSTEYSLHIGTDIKLKSTCSGIFEERDFYQSLFKNVFITPSVMVRKGVIEKHGILFDEDKECGEDTLFMLRVIRNCRGGELHLPLLSIYKLEYGESGLSQNLKKAEQSELNNFDILYKENFKSEKKISFPLLLIIKVFSYVKYFKRILIVKI